MNSVYDPEFWENKLPANVLGGINRARFGKRDILGRYLPNDPVEAQQMISNLPYNHGQQGGQARVIKAQRDSRGRFKRSDHV